MPLSCFSSLISFSSLTAFSTSSVGPLTVTTSDPELGSGNLIFTPPHSFMMDWISLPPEPIMVLWILDGIFTSLLVMLAISFWIFWIPVTALLTFAFLPVMVIMSLSDPESGRSILVSVSSLILRILAPPLPMMNLWNCLKIGTLTWKLLSCISLTILLKYLVHSSTSFLGPLSLTISLLTPRSGKLIWTLAKSFLIFSMFSPLGPISCLWNLFSMIRSFSFSFSIFSVMSISSFLAFSTPALLPSILMRVMPDSESGMLIVTSVSDLILLIVLPPLPIMCLWCLASILISAKLVPAISSDAWRSSSTRAFSPSSGGPSILIVLSSLNPMWTFCRSWLIFWMPAPFLPIMYL